MGGGVLDVRTKAVLARMPANESFVAYEINVEGFLKHPGGLGGFMAKMCGSGLIEKVGMEPIRCKSGSGARRWRWRLTDTGRRRKKMEEEKMREGISDGM